jgi:hypothetical protein
MHSHNGSFISGSKYQFDNEGKDWERRLNRDDLGCAYDHCYYSGNNRITLGIQS